MRRSESNPEWEVHSMIGLLKKREKSQVNNLTLHPKELEKQQQTKPRASRREEIIKIRAELSDTETKKTTKRINKSRSLFFEKKNKIDQLFTKFIKNTRVNTQINKVRNKRSYSQYNRNTKDCKKLL